MLLVGSILISLSHFGIQHAAPAVKSTEVDFRKQSIEGTGGKLG